MTFRNNIPIQAVCAWCGVKELDPTTQAWVPFVEKPDHIVMKRGTCPDCEKKWQTEEKRVNDEIKTNERVLMGKLPPKHVKRQHRVEPRKTQPGTDVTGATACSTQMTTPK